MNECSLLPISFPLLKLSKKKWEKYFKIFIFILFHYLIPNKGLGHLLMGNFRKVSISFYGKYKKLLKKSITFFFSNKMFLKIVCNPIGHQLTFP